jgi:hypothetical protein
MFCFGTYFESGRETCVQQKYKKKSKKAEIKNHKERLRLRRNIENSDSSRFFFLSRSSVIPKIPSIDFRLLTFRRIHFLFCGFLLCWFHVSSGAMFSNCASNFYVLSS